MFPFGKVMSMGTFFWQKWPIFPKLVYRLHCGQQNVSDLLHSNHNFSYEALTIYDGGSNTSPIIGKYCGNSVPTSQTSSSNEIYVQFKTNYYDNDDGGFKLEYHPYSKYL